MDKRLSSVSVLCAIVLSGLLWGAVWQESSQAAPRAAALDVPFFSQTALNDPTVSVGRSERLGNSDLPLWEYGCGVASLAMVYRHYGVDTDVARLNAALRASGGFVGGLLAWGKSDAFVQAGAPWVKGIERINTTRPQDLQARIDAALDNGEPVLAYLNGQHYVVITGVEGDGYRINDPWAVTADAGKAIALEENLLKKGGFNAIRQLVFVSRQAYAPSNGVLVQGKIQTKYLSVGGSQSSLGNPLQAQEALTGGGIWQRFERGAIFAPTSGQPVMLHGPVWEKFQAEGGAAKLGLPRSDVYSYFVGPGVTWRADFANASLLWSEGDRPDRARVIDAASGVRAEYFANPNLSGQPANSRFEEGEPLFDWGEGAPGPWVGVDTFSARYTQRFSVGGLGWWYNFVVDADDSVRVTIDGKNVLDAWESGPDAHKFRTRLGRGEHALVIEYRERSGPAHLRFARSDWPATPVFAAEETVGSFETLPVSVAASLPELGTPIAQATAAAAGVIATLTAEAGSPARPGSTPTPDNAVADAAAANFESWAAANGEPYRDVQVSVTENDGFFAALQVIAWFRPGRAAPWEEREALIECRQVGGEWQCEKIFAFSLTQEEMARRARATTAALQNFYNRFGIAFVYVPAGEFLMGSTVAEVDIALGLCNRISYGSCQPDRFENELPEHIVNLDAFWIGKTEVTNAQYYIFVEAGGYIQSELWTVAGWEWRQNTGATQPNCWDEGKYGNDEGFEVITQPDHPVLCVSWHEAVAYANWLSRESGLPVRLPTEAEWEKAARGTDGRTWPWGNQLPDGTLLNYCDLNCDFDWKDASADDGYRYSAPAGSYLAGASPYGALDIAGNVWEWTASLYKKYPYRADEGRENLEDAECLRVVRGGSWLDAPVEARSALRGPFVWAIPTVGGCAYWGMRLALSAP